MSNSIQTKLNMHIRMHFIYSLSGLRFVKKKKKSFEPALQSWWKTSKPDKGISKMPSYVVTFYLAPRDPPKKCAIVALIVWNACYLASIVSASRNRIPVFLRLAQQLWLESRRMGNIRKETPGTCHKYKQRVLWSLAHRPFDREKEALDWGSGPAPFKHKLSVLYQS